MANDMIGLVGVGKMGIALLVRLRAAGHNVRAYDISPDALAAAEKNGAQRAKSPADAANDCSFVHVILHSDKQVLAVMTEPDGVFAGTTPGTIVLLHSTLLPATTRKIAELAPKGVTVLDAPCTGVPSVLEAGGAVFLLGGPKEMAEKARGHLTPLAKSVHYFGPLGSGNVAKLAKNLGYVVERVMVDEAARLVEAAGLDINEFLAMAKGSSEPRVWGRWEAELEVHDGHATPVKAYGLVSKDIHHAVAVASELGLDLPLTRTAAETASRWHTLWSAEAKGK